MIYRDNKLVKKVVSKGQSVSHRIKGGSTDWVPVTDFAGANRKIEPISVDRASTATYVDKDGLIKTAAANELRVGYSTGEPRVLIEGQSTNLIPWSEDFSKWSSTAMVTQNNGEALITNLTSNPQPFFYNYLQANSGETYSASIYVKGTSNSVGKTIQFAIKRITGGIFISKSTIETLTNSWKRLSIEGLTLNESNSGVVFYIYGTNGTAEEVYVKKAQLEEGSKVTSYIPTNGTTVTRLADVNPIYNLNGLTTDRNSTATYVDVDGLIKTVGPNTPRIDYSTGKPVVLREKEATNLWLFSESKTTNTTVLEYPNNWGIGLSKKIVFSGYTGINKVYYGGKTFMKGDYTISFFIKRVDNTVPVIGTITQDCDVAFWMEAHPIFFNITPFRNGVYHGVIKGHTKGGSNFGFIQSTKQLIPVEISGVMVVSGYHDLKPHSYIPTNGSTITRLADNITVNTNPVRSTRRLDNTLEINPDNKLTTSVGLVDVYDNILPKAMHEAIAPTTVKYGEIDDIKAELDSAYNLKPSLMMLPGKASAGKLESILPADGSGDFTVERNSTATRVNKDGLIEVVPANTPRIDHSTGEPMLLVEGQSTNYALWSEDFSKWPAISQGLGTTPIVTPNYGMSPDGKNNATRLQCNLNGGNTSNDRSWLQLIQETPNITTTTSVWAKLNSGISAVFTLFNNSGKTITLNSTSWVRLSNYKDVLSPNGSFRIGLIGNEIGVSDSIDILIWGAQLEEGTKATSYIPTNGSIVTRLSDNIIVINAENIIGQDKGSIYVEYDYTFSQGPDKYVFDIGLNLGNRMICYYSPSNALNFYVADSGIIQNQIKGNSVKGRSKILVTYDKIVGCEFFHNGIKVGNVSAPFAKQIFNYVKIGGTSGGSNLLSSHKSMKLYKRVLTDQEAISLTTL